MKSQKLRSLLAIAIAGLICTALYAADAKAPATAPSTQPAKSVNNTATNKAIEIQAAAAFNRGDYALALPLLEKLQIQLKDDPARLGQVEEQLRIARKAVEKAANNATPTPLPSDQSARAAPGPRGRGPPPPRPRRRAPPAPPARPGTPPDPSQPPTSPEQRKPHPAPKADQIYSTTIKELGNFEYDAAKGGNIPDDVKRLSGHPIRLQGYMIPLDQAENITQFALVPSLFACCFGQPPQIQHTIVVTCPKGKAVSYYPDEILVEGNLKVEEKKDDGYVVSLFEVDVTSVKPAPK